MEQEEVRKAAVGFWTMEPQLTLARQFHWSKRDKTQISKGRKDERRQCVETALSRILLLKEGGCGWSLKKGKGWLKSEMFVR